VSEVKLLGVYIDLSLSWNKHINYIAGKAGNRALFLKDFETIWCTTWPPFALLYSGHKTCFGILLLHMASQHPPVTFYTDWIHPKTGFKYYSKLQ